MLVCERCGSTKERHRKLHKPKWVPIEDFRTDTQKKFMEALVWARLQSNRFQLLKELGISIECGTHQLSRRFLKMSWSVNISGKPAEIKQAVINSFESAKSTTASVSAENKTVRYAEEIVNSVLEHVADEDVNVKISGHGSACNRAEQINTATGKPIYGASLSFNLSISTE